MNPVNLNPNAQNNVTVLGQRAGVTAGDILNNLPQRFDSLDVEHDKMMDAADEGEIIETPHLREETRLAQHAATGQETVLHAYLRALVPLAQVEEDGTRISSALSTSARGAVMTTLLDALHPAVMSRWDELSATTKEAWIALKFAATGEPYDAGSAHNAWKNGDFSR